MSIKDVHDTILFYTNKSQNGYISHEEIDMVLDRTQLTQFNEYYNNPKLYRQDNQSPIVGYGESQKINDALSPFKATYTFTNEDTPSGVLSMPANYMFLLSLYTTVYVNQIGRNVVNAVTVLNEEELVLRLESQVIPVTVDDPICIMNSNKKIQLFPDIPQAGKVFYFRRPVAPKYNYAPDAQNPRKLNYTSNGSQDLEWGDSEINNIIIKALSFYGVNLSAQDLIQFAEAKNQQGN